MHLFANIVNDVENSCNLECLLEHLVLLLFDLKERKTATFAFWARVGARKYELRNNKEFQTGPAFELRSPNSTKNARFLTGPVFVTEKSKIARPPN